MSALFRLPVPGDMLDAGPRDVGPRLDSSIVLDSPEEPQRSGGEGDIQGMVVDNFTSREG